MARKPAALPGLDQPPAPADHNEPVDTAALAVQADEARYHNLIALHPHHDKRIETKRAELKEITNERKNVRRKLSDAGYPLDIVDEQIADSTIPGRELDSREAMRTKVRRWKHLPVAGADQANLDFTPDFVRGELQYEADGIRAGVNGLDRDAPESVPPEFHNAYEKGWLEGQGRLAWAMQEEQADDARRKTAEEAAAKAAEPEPEFDPDAEARKLKRSDFMDTSAPADEPEAAAETETVTEPEQAAA